MALEPRPGLLNLLGFVAWGDLGTFTCYKSKRKKVVWLAKTWPKKRPSARQLICRDDWAAAAQAWRDLTPPQRQQWHLATRRASLCMHGFNLWMHWWLSRDDPAINTLERQTKTTLYRPDYEGSGSGGGY